MKTQHPRSFNTFRLPQGVYNSVLVSTGTMASIEPDPQVHIVPPSTSSLRILPHNEHRTLEPSTIPSSYTNLLIPPPTHILPHKKHSAFESSIIPFLYTNFLIPFPPPFESRLLTQCLRTSSTCSSPHPTSLRVPYHSHLSIRLQAHTYL